MVSEKMGLPFCRPRRTVYNTNFFKWLFSIINCGKTIQLIFIKFSGFVYHVEDYCCANFRNQQSMFKIELENPDFRKTLYFYILDAKKNGLRLGANI